MGMGARGRRVERLRRLFPDLDRMRGLEGEMDGSWLTLHASREAWFEVPLPVSVCSAGSSDEELDASNFAVAEERLERASLFDDGVSYRTDHWVGPPIRTLVIRADDAGAVREAVDIIASLEAYPVLDEEDYSQRQTEAQWSEWEHCFQSDITSLMVRDHGIPEDLQWGAWGGFDVDLDEVLDGLVDGCETWQDYSLGESIDLDALAAEMAARVRVALAGADAAKAWLRDCWCCSAPVVGPVWALCEGCEGHDRSGEQCDAAESWHCDGRAGHVCDGTVCAELAAAAEYEAALPGMYGGMHPDRMTRLW